MHVHVLCFPSYTTLFSSMKINSIHSLQRKKNNALHLGNTFASSLTHIPEKDKIRHKKGMNTGGVVFPWLSCMWHCKCLGGGKCYLPYVCFQGMTFYMLTILIPQLIQIHSHNNHHAKQSHDYCLSCAPDTQTNPSTKTKGTNISIKYITITF